MNREIHVRFWESLKVRFPWATHLRRVLEGFDQTLSSQCFAA